jgi:hypothetical protein
VGCLYIKKLQEVNLNKLETLVTKAIAICQQNVATSG